MQVPYTWGRTQQQKQTTPNVHVAISSLQIQNIHLMNVHI
jgi:hypothetical protein